MKKAIFIDGGVRHFIGWTGLVNLTLFLFVLFGMFKSLFTDDIGTIVVSLFVSTIMAFLMEIVQAYKRRKGAALSRIKASVPDAICSGIGGLAGAVLAVIFPGSIIMAIVSVILMVLSWLDSKYNTVKKIYEKNSK